MGLCHYAEASCIIWGNTRYRQDFLSTSEDGYCEWVSSIDDIPWKDIMANGEEVFILSRTRWLASQKNDFLMKRGLPFGTLRDKNSPLESKGKIIYSLYKLICGEGVGVPYKDDTGPKEMILKMSMTHVRRR